MEIHSLVSTMYTLCSCLSEHTAYNPIGMFSNLQQDLGLSQHQIDDVILACSDSLGVSLPNGSWEGLSTVGDLFEKILEVCPKMEGK